MSLRVPLLGAALLAVFLTAPSPAQETKTPPETPAKLGAQLVPASTLLYVEMRHPDKLAKEVLALSKGSALDDMPATMARARAKLGDNEHFWFGELIEIFAVFLAPEMIAEAGKLQGGFFAITGVNKDGPEMVGVLQSGTSNAPGFFMRFFLTVDSEMRAREVVEGVQTYQARRRDWNRAVPPGGAPIPGAGPEVKDSGPTFAMLPGMIVMGTKGATHDVIRRYKDKAKGESLSATDAYKATAKLRDLPGVYFQADLPALGKKLDPLFADPKSSDTQMWKMLKLVVNPDAFKMASGNLTLADGKLGLQLHLDLDAKNTSPLMELLPDRKGNLDLLNAAPPDGMLNFTLSFADGATRWQKFVALLDALAKERGEQELPSKQIREVEQKAKLNIGKELFGQVTNVGVVFEGRSVVPKDAIHMPLLLLSAADGDAAKAIEDGVIPKLVSLGGPGDSLLPTREKILEQSISTLPDPTRLWGTLAYGRSGKLVVIGQDRKTVAEALLRHSKKEGVLTHKTIGPVLEKLDGSIGAGTFSPGQSLVELLRDLETPRASVIIRPGAQPKPGPGGDGEKKDPKPEEKPKTFDKYVNLMTKEVEALPPAVLSLTRTKERLSLEVQTAGLRTVSAKIITVWVESAIDRNIRTHQSRIIGGPGAVPEPPPLPPPPVDK